MYLDFDICFSNITCYIVSQFMYIVEYNLYIIASYRQGNYVQFVHELCTTYEASVAQLVKASGL